MKRTPIRRVSDKRRASNEKYLRRVQEFLIEHPWDQVWLCRHGLTEADVRTASRTSDGIEHIPRSTEIHHRNKRDGSRLLDERFWMATSRQSHDMIERNRTWARKEGYLLPINASPNGTMPGGIQLPTTDQLMELKKAEAALQAQL